MDQVNMRKNSCLTNDPIIFMLSEKQFKQIENHCSSLNISAERNKGQEEEVFQVRLKGQRTKGRLMKGYSNHWI